MRLRLDQPDFADTFLRLRTGPFGHPVSGSLSRLIHAVEETARRWLGEISRERLRRSRIQTLQNLSDRQLLDIGVERSDIAATVEKILERKKTCPG